MATPIKPKYVIDTCSLTTLRRVYPKENFKSVWDKISSLAKNNILISTEEVFEEIKQNDDEILKWAKEHDHIFFPHTKEIQLLVKKILVSHTNLFDAKNKKSTADPFLIAVAIINNCALVTEEKPSGGPNKYKIPDVCKDYNVECIDLLTLLKRENLKS